MRRLPVLDKNYTKRIVAYKQVDTLRDHAFYHEFHGWCNALTDAHVQFAVVLEDDLDKLSNEFEVLIVPHAACMPDFSFAGKIIATGDSGKCDSTGEQRATPLLEKTSPVGQFDIAGLPTPIDVIEAPTDFLVRAFHADGGYVTHLLNCGGKPDGDIVICIRGMAEAELLSPSAERALALDILDDRVRFPAASFDTYAVLSSRCGASSRPPPKQA